MDTVNKQCIYCGKDLRGRADKKFCDDYCRNAYNNSQNSDRTRMVRNINNALRKNRRILESLLPAHEATAKVSRQILQTEGFNFKFFTHQYQPERAMSICFVTSMVIFLWRVICFCSCGKKRDNRLAKRTQASRSVALRLPPSLTKLTAKSLTSE